MSLVFNQKITLDLTISRVQNVYCSQDDADSRNILITLSDNGKPYSIPSEVRILLKISKPDNTYVYIDEDDVDHLFRNDDGTISIILSEQATCVPGICEAELQFITPKETISTRKFNIIVKKSVINDEEIESVIESNIIQKMIRHLIDFMNPHKVNKEQVGLGNVPNVITNDQTPTYEEAEEFENISSGEKLSIAFGKIQKAISSLLGHINNFDNPHKTTKSQIQLGNVDNTSDVDKPVSTAQQKAIDGAYANSNKYTDEKIADLIDGAPETMDTLKEVADAIEKSKTVEEALDKSIGTKANQNELDTHTGNDTIHITSDERTKWNDANNKKHSHNNKSVLDGITSELVQKWTETSSSSVTGIKGVNEDSFRRGNVVLTAENVGAVSTGGDTAENTTAFTAAPARENLKSGEKHNILFGKIAKWFADLKTVAFSGSYNDLSNKPTIPTVGNGKVTITQNGATKGSFTMNQSGNTTVELTDNNTTYDLSKYLALTGGTVTGTLVLSKTTDLSGTSDNRPALIVGGAATGVHIEIDNNEIQGKKNEKTPNKIVINANGGDVTIGDTANEYSTTIRNDLIVNKNFYPENSIKMNQSKWLDCIVNYVDSNGAGRADALRLIGCNSSGNVHMGGYSDITIAPVYLHASGKQYNFTDAAFCPNVTNNVHLGLAGKLWKTVYAKTGTINTSDRNKKHDIKDLTEVYEQLFLKLQPKSFIFNDGDRVHIGAISQDVETAMQELGIEAKQFAGFCKDIRYEYTEFSEEDGMPIESSKVPCKDEDGNIIYDYALRYQEFIFLAIHMVQRLWSRLDAIEKENAEIKEQIKSMQQDIEELKKVRA